MGNAHSLVPKEREHVPAGVAAGVAVGDLRRARGRREHFVAERHGRRQERPHQRAAFALHARAAASPLPMQRGSSVGTQA